MKEKNNSSSNAKLKGILITLVSIAVVAIIAVVVLIVSGAFGAKEARLYDGLNELKPGSYVCVNNGSDYIDGYISTDGIYEADDNVELIFRYGNKTSVVVGSGQKIVIWGDDEEVDIICNKS